MAQYQSKYLPLPTQPPEQPAPVGKWSPDILGSGFSCYTIALPRDDEGELFSTLIRYQPGDDPGAIANTPEKPGFAFLYLHGWNDYFFQRELARHVALAGGAFYALDLAKYGRSYRDWMTFGWTEDLRSYDYDLAEARELIKAESGDLPLILSGHSTGGLTAAYWAMRNRDELAGLVLNSPWIEMPFGAAQRKAVGGLGWLVGHYDGKRALPGQKADSVYVDSLAGWDPKIDGDLPVKLEKWCSDPSLAGWDLIRKWKGSSLALLRYGWLSGIAQAQQDLQELPALDIPVFMGTSTTSSSGAKRTAKVAYSDCVLNVETLCAKAWQLSTRLTLCRYRGKHDLWLSFPPVRQAFWRHFHHWVHQTLPHAATNPDTLTTEHLTAICP